MAAAAIPSYLNNKKFLFGAAIVFIFPFILFSFWSFPLADDYMILDKRSQFSFWQLQHFVYQNWTGRYFATFISSLFSYNGLLYSHYYLHTLLLLVLTIFSWLFCLSQINKYLLNKHFTLSSLALFSMLLLVAEMNIIPEPVTAFYWFSSAVTYQTPLIILIFLAGIIIKSLFVPVNIFHFVTSVFLVALLNGCNEMITLFVLIYSSVLTGYAFIKNKNLPNFITVLFTINVISVCFLLFSPGIRHRESLIGHGSLLSAFGAAAVKFLIINWFFLKEPLWWFLLVFIIIFISNHKHLFKAIFLYFDKLPPWILLITYAVSGLLLYIPVLYKTNDSLPLRAENIICFICSLLLLIIISICVSRKINSVFASYFYPLRYLLFSVLIFATANMKNVTDTLLSGFFYQQVMKERLILLENTKQRNVHEVTFDNYETSVSKKLVNYPMVNRQILKEIFLKPPPIISFGNDLYDVNYLKEFYGIQKLNIRRN